MMIRYFAWVRERIGKAEEEVELPQDIETVADLIEWLRSQGEEYDYAFEQAKFIRCAADQTHVSHDFRIGSVKEVAFFPPMTGG